MGPQVEEGAAGGCGEEADKKTDLVNQRRVRCPKSKQVNGNASAQLHPLLAPSLTSALWPPEGVSRVAFELMSMQGVTEAASGQLWVVNSDFTLSETTDNARSEKSCFTVPGRLGHRVTYKASLRTTAEMSAFPNAQLASKLA